MVILAVLLGFAGILNAQNASFPKQLVRTILAASPMGTYPPVSLTVPTPMQTGVASAGLIIIPTFDVSVDSATQAAIQNVINFYESTIRTNLITIRQSKFQSLVWYRCTSARRILWLISSLTFCVPSL